MMATAKTLWGNYTVDGLVHTAPCDGTGAVIQDHVESMNCWCAPVLAAVCPACIDDPNCWKCGGKKWIAGSILDPPNVCHVTHRNFGYDDDGE